MSEYDAAAGDAAFSDVAAPNGKFLNGECRRLLAFGRSCPVPGRGAAYLNDTGAPAPEFGIRTMITARMVHVYSIGAMLGVDGCGEVADVVLSGLTGALHDDTHGGWFAALRSDGEPDREAGKLCYDHAFVMLAASSALLAGRPGASELLSEAAGIYRRWFLDHPGPGDATRPIDRWDAAFTTPDPYRGLNGAMHSVEAMLAVADALGPAEQSEASQWRHHAAHIADMVVDLAVRYKGRLPEHFDADWNPDLECGRNRPDDPFKPFGATPGHGMEWARLLLQLEASTIVASDASAPAASSYSVDETPSLGTALMLFDRAAGDAWGVDGADGFVYTTDFAGRPVIRQRMHWVVAEAINTAAALGRRTGEERFAAHYRQWWNYADHFLIDRENGSWHHELDPANRPANTVWPGKPDLYHALQATLIPRAPLNLSIARAVHDNRV